MKKKLILAAWIAVFACACEPKAADSQKMDDSQKMQKEMPKEMPNDQNFHDRRKQQQAPQRPQGGCCENEKPAPESQTASTPEVKVEIAK